MTDGEEIKAFVAAYYKIPECAQVGQPIKLMKFQRQFKRSSKMAFGLLIAVSYVLLLVTSYAG